MPLGSKHMETGLILREGDWLVLQRDDGGRWRLEGKARVMNALAIHLGQRVRIEGVRDGFDLLFVKKLFAADKAG